ncbi:cobalamin-dependent protein [Acholeplasma vituli]|uniref:Cobalamin-dependent protein n=1 Tax=Paracholeplasma vituli TaxID=69473 RepID=A0ABT2PW99_9MOLU|nr:cobalamin-dependent protein [Paracholeplasma vituli]MCU0105236.1 cobalamin-dependent protein [Paracholeplasma vituli]
MNPYYPKFLDLVNHENKDEAMLYVLELLKEKKIELYDLYDFFLRPVLNEFECNSEDEEICIWKEHVRTSIVRTILESTYPYLIENKKTVKKNNKKVVVVCPSEEFHEVGAIIVTNYFTLAGFDAQYIGANTPKNDIVSAVKALKPDYLALSVTNYYNLVVTKQITEQVKGLFPNVKVILGGNAFNKPGALDHLVYDYHLKTKEDIFILGGK